MCHGGAFCSCRQEEQVRYVNVDQEAEIERFRHSTICQAAACHRRYVHQEVSRHCICTNMRVGGWELRGMWQVCGRARLFASPGKVVGGGVRPGPEPPVLRGHVVLGAGVE